MRWPPGLIATEALLAGMRDPEVQTAVQRHIPEGRFGRPEEITAAILFAASPEASYLNGAIIPVDAALGAREFHPPPEAPDARRRSQQSGRTERTSVATGARRQT